MDCGTVVRVCVCVSMCVCAYVCGVAAFCSVLQRTAVRCSML